MVNNLKKVTLPYDKIVFTNNFYSHTQFKNPRRHSSTVAIKRTTIKIIKEKKLKTFPPPTKKGNCNTRIISTSNIKNNNKIKKKRKEKGLRA